MRWGTQPIADRENHLKCTDVEANVPGWLCYLVRFVVGGEEGVTEAIERLMAPVKAGWMAGIPKVCMAAFLPGFCTSETPMNAKIY